MPFQTGGLVKNKIKMIFYSLQVQVQMLLKKIITFFPNFSALIINACLLGFWQFLGLPFPPRKFVFVFLDNWNIGFTTLLEDIVLRWPLYLFSKSRRQTLLSTCVSSCMYYLLSGNPFGLVVGFVTGYCQCLATDYFYFHELCVYNILFRLVLVNIF